MTFSYVQSAPAGTSNNAVFGAPVGSGHMVTGYTWIDSTTTPTAISATDDKGNSYVFPAAAASGPLALGTNYGYVYGFYLLNITNAPTTITVSATVTGSGTGIFAVVIDEFSSTVAATFDIATGQAQTSGTGVGAITSGSMTIAGGLVSAGIWANGTLTAGSGYTLATNDTVDGEFSEYALAVAAGPAAATATQSASGWTWDVAMAFTAAAAAGQVPYNPQPLFAPLLAQ